MGVGENPLPCGAGTLYRVFHSPSDTAFVKRGPIKGIGFTCVVGGSIPPRQSGSSAGRVHNQKSGIDFLSQAVRIRKKSRRIVYSSYLSGFPGADQLFADSCSGYRKLQEKYRESV